MDFLLFHYAGYVLAYLVDICPSLPQAYYIFFVALICNLEPAWKMLISSCLKSSMILYVYIQFASDVLINNSVMFSFLLYAPWNLIQEHLVQFHSLQRWSTFSYHVVLIEQPYPTLVTDCNFFFSLSIFNSIISFYIVT